MGYSMSITYKLYKFNGELYAIPLDKYEYIDDMAFSYFIDYCAGLLTIQELNGFVEEVVLGNGGVVLGTKNDKGFYVVKGKE